MAKSNWVIAIGFKQFLLEVVARTGAQVFLIDEITKLDFAARDRAGALMALSLNTEFETILAVIRAWRRRHPIASVVSMSDSTLFLAARLNHALCLPGIDLETTQLLSDKAQMRERMARCNIPSIPWSRVGSADELIRFVGRVKAPIIVKPIDGEASRNVYRIVAESAAASELWPRLAVIRENGWIAEAFLDGEEFSVETVSEAGRHHVLAITQKYKGDNFVEIGHRVPAEIPRSQGEQIANAAREFLSAIGLNFGIAHTEIILTSSGPRIVESQNRVGGDRIGRLVEMATGIHPVYWMIERLLGRPVALPPEMSTSRGAAICFLTSRPGRIVAIDGLEAASAVAGVKEVEVSAVLGSEISHLRSSADRLGHVVAEGLTSQLAYQACLDAVERIEVTVV